MNLINQVFNEDCLETLSRIETGIVDLLLQDTPFGCTQNDWDIKPDLPVMWEHWNRVTKIDGAMVFFGTQPFASELIMSNIKNFRYDLIWYKSLGTGFLNANKMPLRNHETILVFYRKLPTYNPQMEVGKMKSKGRTKVSDRLRPNNYGSFKDIGSKINDLYLPESVVSFSNGNNNQMEFHPTQKPDSIIRYLIKTYSNEGDTVFDGYMGSGTTAIACIKEKRNFIGSELNTGYYEQLQKRIETELLQPELF